MITGENNKTILLVEDEGIIALARAKALQKHGYKVIIVPSGEKAVEASRDSSEIDLVLMDVNLGNGIDGTQAAELILAQRDLPLIFLSSHTEPEVVEKTGGITSYGYVIKNSGETVLLASIQMAFRLFEAKQKLMQAEKTIEHERKFLATILDSLPVGVCLNDQSGHYRMMNNAYCEIYEYEREEMIGKHYSVIMPPDQVSLANAHYARLLSGDTGIPVERKRQRKDGSIVYIEAANALVDDVDGKKLVITTVHEITERKQAEETLMSALKETSRGQREMQALLSASRVIIEQDDFEVIARHVFDSCKDLTGATAGYVALLSEDGYENEVLFLDPGGNDCTVDSSLPMPIRGLRSEAYRTRQTVFDNDFDHSEWVQFIPGGHAPLENVMFAPLVIEGKTQGLMGLANKSGGFTENDARIATAFGELASIALRNSWTMSKLHNLQEKLREQAIRDPLTELFNRRYLQEMLEREVSRAKRDEKPVSLVIMDVDYFKRINDSYGHVAGDEMLRAIGRLIKANVRLEDIACRYGGEEFLIVMPGVSAQVAQERAKTLHEKIIALRLQYKKHEIHTTISLGIATFPEHGSSGDEVLIRADRALYQAKRDGRNRISVFQDSRRTPHL